MRCHKLLGLFLLIIGGLMSENVHKFTDQNFDSDVSKSNIPVLIDFWASWCGPCKAIAPVIDEIAGEYNGKVKVGKVDVDQNQDTAMKYGVRSIPTLLIIKDGKVVNQIVGAVPKGNITTMLDEII
jgi:thioredoxin 1